ncbi:MAG: phosphopyruvate hydratase [Candidatus Pacearchaeota archaeon]
MQPQEISARKILNSKGKETISVIVKSQGKIFETSAPEGTSKGKYEVSALSEKGIDFSISLVNALGKKIVQDKLIFCTFDDLEKLESLVKQLDKTNNFSVIGGNSLYALEASLLKAIAASYKQELWQFLLENKKAQIPKPLGNCIGGGKHTEQELRPDFQEFLVMPRTEHFFDSYFINLQTYKETKSLLQKKDKTWQGTLTYENALASTMDNESILDLLQEVKEKIKEKYGIEILIGVDIAADSLWQDSRYRYQNFKKEKPRTKLTEEAQLEYVRSIINKYNLFYVEDPFHDKAFESFSLLLKKTKNCLICGDDLTCTHMELVKKTIDMKAINSLIVKPNQVASLLETKKVIDFAKKNNITLIISHRSGETYDNTIAHLAVGWQIPIIKTGILGKERFAKLHELLRIERQLR